MRKELDGNDYSFGHLTLTLLLHYLVKCRSCSLAIYNNDFLLDSACVNSEMINWKATNTIGNCCISKSHTCFSHAVYYSMCSKCLPTAQMQTANFDTTSKQQAQQPAFHKVV